MTASAHSTTWARPRADAVTWLTVYIVFLFAIPSRLVVEQLGSAGAPSMLVGLVSLMGWSLYQLSRSTGDLRTRPVRFALVAFLLCVGASYVAAMAHPIDYDEVSPADVAVLAVASWSGTLLVVHDGVTSLDRLRVLAGRLGWAGGLLALLGLAQFVIGDAIVDRISIPGLSENMANLYGRQGFIRPNATATHPIEFGVLLTMLLPFALHSALHFEHRHRIVGWLPVLLIGCALPVTFSRSAYVGAAVALTIMFAGWPAARRRTFTLALLALLTLMFAAVPKLFGTISGLFSNLSEDPSVGSRTDSYALAWDFIAQAPLLGRGPGTFLPKYRILDNQWLLLLVTVGLVGTAAFLVLACTAMWAQLSVRQSTRDPELRDLTLSVTASLAAGTISLAFFDAFAFPMTMGTLFIVLGFSGALFRLARRATGLGRELGYAEVDASTRVPRASIGAVPIA